MYPSLSKVHAGSFHVSVIHQTLSLKWNVNILMKLMRVWRGLGTASQHIFYLEKLTIFVCAPDRVRFEPRVFGAWLHEKVPKALQKPPYPKGGTPVGATYFGKMGQLHKAFLAV